MTEVKSEVATKLPALLGKDEIKSGQDGIRKDLIGLDQRIHANAVQCLMHAEKHGDTSLMRRLLVEIIDAKTGYRRQGLIAWMRSFSPMELKGDVINLSGMLNGKKRPFNIAKANITPFYLARQFAEKPLRPVYQQTLLSKINAALKEWDAAKENTVNGQPVDATKPFFDGLHADKMDAFFAEVRAKQATLPADMTLDVAKARLAAKQNLEFVEEHSKDARAEGPAVVAA